MTKIPTTMNEEWIEQMRQKMADYQWPAPELSWDELDQALTANKPRKTRVLWLHRIAAAAVILLIAGVGYWGFLKNHGDWHNDSSAAKIRVPVPVILAQDSVQNQAPIPVILASSGQKSAISEDPVLESETIILVSTASHDTVNTIAIEEKEQLPTAEERAKPVDNTPSVIYPSDLYQRKHIDSRLTAKVYMSSTTEEGQTKYYNIQGGGLSPDVQTTQIEQNVHHHQPVRFGFSLRYRLDDRWSIESGLTYTRLSSDISTTVDGVTTMTEQHLNYIGLPLNISYELWKSRHFGLYVTAGGTIEKSLDTSPWQFSLNGAVGAEYKLTDYFSLYAEPGLGYYFNDGSTTPTIYQDHPLNINLSFGLRFNLKSQSVKVR